MYTVIYAVRLTWEQVGRLGGHMDFVKANSQELDLQRDRGLRGSLAVSASIMTLAGAILAGAGVVAGGEPGGWVVACGIFLMAIGARSWAVHAGAHKSSASQSKSATEHE